MKVCRLAQVVAPKTAAYFLLDVFAASAPLAIPAEAQSESSQE
jgi:hypothetical protein